MIDTIKTTVCFLLALTVTERGKDTNRQIKTQGKSQAGFEAKKWSEWTDLNRRQSRWQRDALPAELHSHVHFQLMIMSCYFTWKIKKSKLKTIKKRFFLNKLPKRDIHLAWIMKFWIFWRNWRNVIWSS